MGDFVVTDEWNRENIIQRLRLADINEQLPFHELRNEAADEIERLRTQLATAHGLLREACRGTCTVTADWYERAKNEVGE